MRGAYSSKKNFLFDLDGTLIDSTGAHARAFVDALSTSRPELARTFDYAPFAGRPTRDAFVALGLQDDAELTELTHRKQQNYRDALTRGEVTIFPGAIDVLERLQQQNSRLFLVTGASRISVERVLQATKLARFFEAIITADDVHPGKPFPDPYLQTLVRNNLKKEESLAIEDAESGVVSAQRADVEVVLINTDLQMRDVHNVGNFAAFATLLFS